MVAKYRVRKEWDIRYNIICDITDSLEIFDNENWYAVTDLYDAGSNRYVVETIMKNEEMQGHTIVSITKINNEFIVVY